MNNNLTIITHPDSFKEGIRILFLTGRNKDGAETLRTVTMISHSVQEWDVCFDRLCRILNSNERIYASANQRDIKNAIKLFERRQMDARHTSEDPNLFYRKIHDRWVSCLARSPSKVGNKLGDKYGKLWKFDIDTPIDEENIKNWFRTQTTEKREMVYSYETKNGRHIFINPCNRQNMEFGVNNILNMNPDILVAY